jgi:membrane protease YdiL (CAAX protease family)
MKFQTFHYKMGGETLSMSTEPPFALNFDPATGQPPPAGPREAQGTQGQNQLIAPVWHTIVILAIILANSYFASTRLANNVRGQGRVLLYLSTIAWQLVLFGLVWIGLQLRKIRLREIIGGRWNTVEDFLIDVAFAAGFWLASSIILAGLKFAFGLASLDAKQSAEQVKQAIGSITPRTGTELAVFVLLTVFAGIVEEIVFRGYLQRQIGAMVGNIYVGLGISAVIFGAGHGYQGTRQMILIAIYGAMFGTLALLRKSLRPGMMAHAWQDAFSGIAIYVLTKAGKM